MSLLVAELSFAAGSEHHDHAKVAIFTASVVAAVIASILLGFRNGRYRRLAADTVGGERSPALPQ